MRMAGGGGYRKALGANQEDPHQWGDCESARPKPERPNEAQKAAEELHHQNDVKSGPRLRQSQS